MLVKLTPEGELYISPGCLGRFNQPNVDGLSLSGGPDLADVKDYVVVLARKVPKVTVIRVQRNLKILAWGTKIPI
jgi:hypothetical protein